MTKSKNDIMQLSKEHNELYENLKPFTNSFYDSSHNYDFGLVFNTNSIPNNISEQEKKKKIDILKEKGYSLEKTDFNIENGEKTITSPTIEKWRQNLKEKYLEFAKNPEFINLLNKYKNNYDNYVSKHEEVRNNIYPKRVIKAIEGDELQSIFDAENVSPILYGWLNGKVPFYNNGYMNLFKGPVPDEYLNKIDEWFDIYPEYATHFKNYDEIFIDD